MAFPDSSSVLDKFQPANKKIPNSFCVPLVQFKERGRTVCTNSLGITAACYRTEKAQIPKKCRGECWEECREIGDCWGDCWEQC